MAPLAAMLALGISLKRPTPVKQSQEETILTPGSQAGQVLNLQPTGESQDSYSLDTQQANPASSSGSPHRWSPSKTEETCTERMVESWLTGVSCRCLEEYKGGPELPD